MNAEQMLFAAFCFLVWSLSAASILLMVAAWCWAIYTIGQALWRLFHAR